MKTAVACLPFIICTALHAQIIPGAMRVDWSKAGYEGSIPDPANVLDVTGYGAVANDNSDDYSAIISAMNALSGQQGVIYFPPGIYDVRSTLNLADSVVLRGA